VNSQLWTEGASPWPHEREALAFVRARFPSYEPYRAWTNVEFIAEDGSANEVDLKGWPHQEESSYAKERAEQGTHDSVNRGDDTDLTRRASDQPDRRVAFLAAGGRQPRGRTDQDEQREQQGDGTDAERQPVQVGRALRLRGGRDLVDSNRIRQGVEFPVPRQPGNPRHHRRVRAEGCHVKLLDEPAFVDALAEVPEFHVRGA
jgi:hypothetical protein